MTRTTASVLLFLGALGLAVVAAPPGRCDEIRYTDPTTCETVDETVGAVVDESWTTISYRGRTGTALKRVDTRFVVDIRRDDSDPNAAEFEAAMTDFRAGNWSAARQAFGTIAGGGRTQDPTTGKIEYRPFPAAEGTKSKWYIPYAHYHYAAASLEEGLSKGDAELIGDALRAVDADSGAEKGFLPRYKEGKSRWYGDAWVVKGRAQAALKKFDDAAATFDGLYQKSLTTPIGVRFAYEAKVGAGLTAEAKGDVNGAESAYEAAAAALQSLFDQTQDACSRRDLGRYYHEARIQKARLMLAQAEKSGSAADYGRLRTYVQQGSPEAMRAKFAGKPADIVDAVLAGALTPSVQAVAQNGIGMAFLAEKKYAQAVTAFTNVRIKYFTVATEVPRALRYLAQAADAAAAAATKADAKALYQEQAAAARQELERWQKK